jgi:beta-lactamase class A
MPRRGCAYAGGRRWLLALYLCVSGATASAGGGWQDRLAADLAHIGAGPDGLRIGVYVRSLPDGGSVAFHADQSWYLASTVKVPVAIAVLRGVARGAYSLDTPVTLRADDYVDGAGSTNHQPVGAALPIRRLLEQMIIHSDNTATDMLIGLVGLDQVNAVTAEVAPAGFGPITRLAEVRRSTYGQLVPAAQSLAGRNLLLLRQQRSDDARLQYLARIVQVPVADFRLPTLGEAYDAYYATGLNAGRLDALGELLAQLDDGRLLPPAQTRYLLDLMERVVTGPQRIRAGLPASARFAHKTGTQRGRFCDAGIVQPAGAAPRVLVVACTRGHLSLARAERALREVGAALCRSGVLTQGVPDAPSCPVRLPAAGVAAPP